MISDIQDHAVGSTLQADVVVVGSGVAGAELARFLGKNGRRVLLLESGRREFDPAIQSLNGIRFVGKPHRVDDGEVHPYLHKQYRGSSRVRQFGGTSNTWTGKWRAFVPSTFHARSWVPDSSWPIRFEDLLPHYRACLGDYGIADVFARAEDAEVRSLDAELEPVGLHTSVAWWEGSPLRTGERFGAEFAASEQVHVVLGATATELILGEDSERVCAVVGRSLEGGHVTARAAEAVVLATGALEAPRLLLASNRQVPAGIGNAHGLVGRFYHDHGKNSRSRLVPGSRIRALSSMLQYEPKPRFGVGFSLREELQENERILGHSILLRPVYATGAGRWLRRLPGRGGVRDGVGAVRHYAVKFAFEQAPQRDSRVYLGDAKDPLGVPELVMDWRFNDLDHRTHEVVCRLGREAFARAGFGTVELERDPLDLDRLSDAAHHMGTTRMAARPEEGVVDADCRVFGCQNLYVASSAVFPTGQVYSPTLTILALARRLGEHLLRQ